MSPRQLPGRFAYNEDHEAFRQTVRSFLQKEGVPNVGDWEKNRLVPKEFWRKAGEIGMLCPTVPEEYGGLGLDFGYNAIVNEEMAYNGVPAGFTLQSDIVSGYIEHYGSRRAEEAVAAAAGQRRDDHRDRDDRTRHRLRPPGDPHHREEGRQPLRRQRQQDLHHQRPERRPVLVVAKTDPDAQPAYKGMSIILVEATARGSSAGRKLDKIGQDAADTSELFFEDVRVPMTNCLGEEGKGFIYLMSQLPQERLSIAIGTQASAQKAFDETVEFTKTRKAFAGMVFDFQNTRFVLADLQVQAAGRLGASRLGDPAASEGRTYPDRGRGGQVVAHRTAMGSDGQMPPATRRRGLYERISDRPHVARGARVADLRRHQRDHEGIDRTFTLTLPYLLLP